MYIYSSCSSRLLFSDAFQECRSTPSSSAALSLGLPSPRRGMLGWRDGQRGLLSVVSFSSCMSHPAVLLALFVTPTHTLPPSAAYTCVHIHTALSQPLCWSRVHVTFIIPHWILRYKPWGRLELHATWHTQTPARHTKLQQQQQPIATMSESLS